MLVRDIFLEAGVNTASVHMAALAAIPEAIRTGAQQVITEAKQELYGISDEPPPEDSSLLATQINDWVLRRTLKWSVLTVLRFVSDDLSKVARDGTKDRFPEDFPNVTVMARQFSTHPSRSAGGSYGSVGHNINIFCDSQDVLDVLQYTINDILNVQETDPSGVSQFIDEFISQVASTFAHEYAHFEQFLRDPRDERVKHKRSDFTYVTIDPKDGSSGGRRGGFARLLRTPTEQLRYYASSGEIDSFASGAAAAIIAKIRNEHQDWNWMVERLRAWLSERSSDLPVEVRRYRNLLRDAFEGRFEDTGLDPQQLVKVKQRFEKLVYQKLGDYLKPTAGKASEVDTAAMPASWVKKARSSSRGEMFVTLAGMVAKNLHDTGAEIDPERIMSGTASDLQYDAERFLRNYYLGGQYRASADAIEKLSGMFRRLLAREVSKVAVS